MRRLAVAALLPAVLLLASPAGAQRPAAARGAEADINHEKPGVGSGAGVSYNGGPVLHSNRTHVIFWQPQGSHLSFDPGYVPLVEGFLRDVAAASHSTTNVFGLLGQYDDYTHRPAAYASTWGGPVIDTDRLPPNQCLEPATGPRWLVCLTDSQLQAEIEHVVRQHHLPTRQRDVYFLVTPRGLGSCMDSTSTSCALGGAVSGYCGYHSTTSPRHIDYAVIPYNAVRGHCQSNNPRPNDSTADPALSTISHELSETVTDPTEQGWTDGSGEEIGDLCISTFGRAIGGSGRRRYNESIHGGHFYLQEEWSNANGRCAARAKPDHVSFSITSKAKLARSFSGTGRDPEGRIVSYNWAFGDGSAARGRDVRHTFPHRGSYSVTVRGTDSWDNWAFYTRRIGVA